jgi:hypothetical protein
MVGEDSYVRSGNRISFHDVLFIILNWAVKRQQTF